MNVALAVIVGVAMLLVSGAASFASGRLDRILRTACLILGAVLAAYVFTGARAMTGADFDDSPAALWLVLTQSHFGATAAIAMGAALVMIVATQCKALRGRNGLFLLGLAAFVLARAASGHAAEQDPVSFHVLIHAIHLLASTTWSGAVIVCVLLTPDWTLWPHRQCRALAHGLSSMATLALTAVIATGLFNAVQMLSDIDYPRDSGYADLLLAKLCLVAIAVGLGAFNRWHWLARIDHDEVLAVAGFRRILLIEAAVLLAILATAASLGNTMPA